MKLVTVVSPVNASMTPGTPSDRPKITPQTAPKRINPSRVGSSRLLLAVTAVVVRRVESASVDIAGSSFLMGAGPGSTMALARARRAVNTLAGALAYCPAPGARVVHLEGAMPLEQPRSAPFPQTRALARACTGATSCFWGDAGFLDILNVFLLLLSLFGGRED
jgi:hypothetical protein